MEIFPSQLGFLNSFLANYSQASLFLIIFIEEAGIPLPVPGDVFIALAGASALLGKTTFLGVVSTVFLATISGASVLYFASNKLGRPLFLKVTHFLRIKEKDIRRAQEWFGERGGWAIVAGRLTPGFRTLTSIASGIMNFPYLVFVSYTAVATLIWGTIYFLLGYFLGTQIKSILELVGRYSIFLVVFFILLTLFIFFYLRKRKTTKVNRQMI